MRHPVRRLHHCTHPRGRGGAVILALLGAALALPCTADNLVPNHSFEELDPETAAPEGWTNWATPNFAVYTLATARTGVAAVAITDDSPQASHGLRSPRIPVEPGNTYQASVWTKIEWVDQGTFAFYLEFWQGGTRIWNRAVATPDALDWRELTLTGNAPDGATHATVLVYSASATVGRAYFDDASLVLVEDGG